MNRETKKKLRIVLIVFLILMIPSFFVIKRMIAIQIHDDVINMTYKQSHVGLDETILIKLGIADLERAKNYSKSNYLIYFDQARLYCKLNDYNKALGVLDDYLKIDSQKQGMYYLKGLIYDIQNKRDSAISNYKLGLLDKKDLKIKSDSLSLPHWIFMIYGKDSALRSLSNLRVKGLDSTMINSMKLHFDTITYKDFALENIQ